MHSTETKQHIPCNTAVEESGICYVISSSGERKEITKEDEVKLAAKILRKYKR